VENIQSYTLSVSDEFEWLQCGIKWNQKEIKLGQTKRGESNEKQDVNQKYVTNAINQKDGNAPKG
jgi:hypothetical protein